MSRVRIFYAPPLELAEIRRAYRLAVFRQLLTWAAIAFLVAAALYYLSLIALRARLI